MRGALWALLAYWVGFAAPGWAQELSAPQRAVLAVAANLLDTVAVSYVYGGNALGGEEACKLCNSCLVAKAPSPAQRLRQCPVCRQCSLDCSHFTAAVFSVAGHSYPYLDTGSMRALSATALASQYQLLDLGSDPERAQPGDLLIYDGHVVILERRHADQPGLPAGRGDIIHSTSGRAVRRPGEGIQRERFVSLGDFRGPLRRILRHRALAASMTVTPAVAPVSPITAGAASYRLRPVVKKVKGPDDDAR